MNFLQPLVSCRKPFLATMLVVLCACGCATEWDKKVGKATCEGILKEKLTPPWKDELKANGERQIIWREGPYVQHNLGTYSGHETVSYYYQTFVFDKQGVLKSHESGFRNSQ